MASHYLFLKIERRGGGLCDIWCFRAYPAYQYTVEHSVYVHKNYYKKGIATKLMHVFIEHAHTHEVKTMVACIDQMKMKQACYIHERLGFTYSGTIRNAGYKFGRWLDLVFYQLDLEGPNHKKISYDKLNS